MNTMTKSNLGEDVVISSTFRSQLIPEGSQHKGGHWRQEWKQVTLTTVDLALLCQSLVNEMHLRYNHSPI